MEVMAPTSRPGARVRTPYGALASTVPASAPPGRGGGPVPGAAETAAAGWLALLTAGAFAAALGAEEPGLLALFLIFSFPVTVPVLVLAASVARTRSRLRRADGSIVASAARALVLALLAAAGAAFFMTGASEDSALDPLKVVFVALPAAVTALALAGATRLLRERARDGRRVPTRRVVAGVVAVALVLLLPLLVVNVVARPVGVTGPELRVVPVPRAERIAGLAVPAGLPRPGLGTGRSTAVLVGGTPPRELMMASSKLQLAGFRIVLSTPSSQVLRGAVDGVAVQVSLVVARTPDGTVVTVGVDPAP